MEVTDTSATIDVTSVASNGQVSFTSAVALNTAGTAYTITLGGGATTTVSKSFLDSVLTAAQADVSALAAVTSAETALASAMVDVLEAQDSEFDGSAATFASLDAEDAITVAGDNAVTLDYSEATEDGTPLGAVAAGAADIDTYSANLVALAGAQSNKADFEEAVTDWQGTEALVDELASLNTELAGLNTAVTDAQAAIENDEDADPAGLGVTLLEGNDNFTADDDVYLFAEAGSDQTLTGFGVTGEDKIFFGEGFSLVEIAEGSDINDNVGNVGELEILWQEVGGNLTLYVETETFGGNSAGTNDVVTIELTGVSAEDVSFAGGYLSAGTAAA
nr:hypothetical protein [Halomonas sp. UBA3074]